MLVGGGDGGLQTFVLVALAFGVLEKLEILLQRTFTFGQEGFFLLSALFGEADPTVVAGHVVDALAFVFVVSFGLVSGVGESGFVTHPGVYQTCTADTTPIARASQVLLCSGTGQTRAPDLPQHRLPRLALFAQPLSEATQNLTTFAQPLPAFRLLCPCPLAP